MKRHPGSASIWSSLLWQWLAHLESDSQTKRLFSVRYEYLWPKCKLCPSPFKSLPGKFVFKRWGTDNLFSLTFLFPAYAQSELLAIHAAHGPEGCLGEEGKDHSCLFPEQTVSWYIVFSPERNFSRGFLCRGQQAAWEELSLAVQEMLWWSRTLFPRQSIKAQIEASPGIWIWLHELEQ